MALDLDTIGDYQVVSELGAGGMGKVYFAVSPTADRVAVKVIKSDLVSDPVVRQRFAAEVESLKLVFGARVARLENADLFAEPAWLAVEYVPGLTVRQHVERRGPLPAPHAAMIGAMLADGLGRIHQAGLLHRDLKPQNVILGPDGPVVIDFGLAVLRDRESHLTEPGAVVGTPAYMSPEQVNGARELTPAIDIYGLAATLVYALTGHGLYPAGNGWGLLLRIADPEDLPDLSGVPAELAPLLGAMLAFDPTARPALEAVRARLLEVATAEGTPVVELRRQVAALTYDESAEQVSPPQLSDPRQDPESQQPEQPPQDEQPVGPVETEEPGQPAPPPRQRPDVAWLIERMRSQYARRATF